MRGGSLCCACEMAADFDGDQPVVDDRDRTWCTSCAAGLLAQVGDPAACHRSIEKDKMLREAEKLEKRAAELRAEASKP